MCLCLLALSGCAGTDVKEAGAGRYTITATSTKGLVAARTDAVKRANKYCAQTGHSAVVESYEDVRLGGVLGDPTASIAFTCGAPTTTAMHR
jgi:hypothetical protein